MHPRMQAVPLSSTRTRALSLHVRRRRRLYISTYIISAAANDDADFGFELDGQRSESQSSSSSLSWLVEQQQRLTSSSEKEELEAEMAASVGLTLKESAFSAYQHQREQEDDEARFHFHRQLHACAERGDFVNAEGVMKQMNESGMLPGSKAFHALTLAYVKGGYGKGALGAIRTEVSKGVRPLPQTYAAVVLAFLREGDVETAQAVYASNRRAEGVGTEQSWKILTGALFARSGGGEVDGGVDGGVDVNVDAEVDAEVDGSVEDDGARTTTTLSSSSTRREEHNTSGYYERAMELLGEGEAQGLVPDRPLYERMIEAMCREGDVASARDRLVRMKKQGLVVEKKVLASVVTGFALAGMIDEAERGLVAMVRAPGIIEAGVIGAVNAVLLSYLREEDMGKEELAERISWVRGQMVVGGLSLDRKGVSLLLSASVLLEDVNVGKLAFDALWGQPATSGTRLMYVSDDCLGRFLHELSVVGDVESVGRCLDLIVSEGREIPGERGMRTFLTAWVEAAGAESKTQQVFIDGVCLDDQTLCVTDDAGNTMAVTKMTVKQLRAELSLRNQETRGNKAELIRTLKKARKAAEEGESSSEPADNKKKIDVIVSNVTWNAGTVSQRRSMESKVDANDDEEDDGVQDTELENDVENENDDDMALMSMDDTDDEDTFEYDDRISSIMRLRNATSRLGDGSSLDVGDPARCALTLANKAKLAAFRPTPEDLEFLRGLDGESESKSEALEALEALLL